jgi:uncharacterized protein YegL
MAFRPLHFFWVADCSGSMQGRKIEQLNQAIRESLPSMQQVADHNPHAQVFVRAIAFSSGARWHVEAPTMVGNFRWPDLRADGVTDLGRGLKLLASQLSIPPMEDRALPPVMVLLSDGQPTDDYKSGLQQLNDLPWGKKAVRIAIAIGDDADENVLQEFLGNSELKPLRAHNATQLTHYIRWASTAVLNAASSPSSQPAGAANSRVNVVITPPVVPDPTDAGDVW